MNTNEKTRSQSEERFSLQGVVALKGDASVSKALDWWEENAEMNGNIGGD